MGTVEGRRCEIKASRLIISRGRGATLWCHRPCVLDSLISITISLYIIIKKVQLSNRLIEATAGHVAHRLIGVCTQVGLLYLCKKSKFELNKQLWGRWAFVSLQKQAVGRREERDSCRAPGQQTVTHTCHTCMWVCILHIWLIRIRPGVFNLKWVERRHQHIVTHHQWCLCFLVRYFQNKLHRKLGGGNIHFSFYTNESWRRECWIYLHLYVREQSTTLWSIWKYPPSVLKPGSELQLNFTFSLLWITLKRPFLKITLLNQKS